MIPVALSAGWSALAGLMRSSIGRLVLVGLVALAVGAWQGWTLRARLDESAVLRRAVETLAHEVRVRDAAAAADQARAGIDAADRRVLEEKIDALTARPPAGGCLDARDAGRLRHLWDR